MAPSPELPEPSTEEPVEGERAMSFLDHLEELRWTLIKSAGAFLAAFIFSAVFFKQTIHLLNWPLEFGLRDADPESFNLITSTPLAAFSVFMVVCFLGAVTLSLPVILFFIGQFVAPALTPKEKRLLLPGCAAGLTLFLLGCLFSYYLLVPSVIKVAVYSNDILGTKLFWSVDSYYSMLAWMIIGLGAAFQFPMVIQVVVYLGLVSVASLRKWRRVMIVVCFVVAAAITPTPDPVTMFIVAAPLILLYELAIWVAAVYTTRKMEASRREAGLD